MSEETASLSHISLFKFLRAYFSSKVRDAERMVEEQRAEINKLQEELKMYRQKTGEISGCKPCHFISHFLNDWSFQLITLTSETLDLLVLCLTVGFSSSSSSRCHTGDLDPQ